MAGRTMITKAEVRESFKYGQALERERTEWILVQTQFDPETDERLYQTATRVPRTIPSIAVYRTDVGGSHNIPIPYDFAIKRLMAILHEPPMETEDDEEA